MSVVDVPARYFFLSYAHTPPAVGGANPPPEHWVNEFFEDLTRQVSHLANPTKRLAPGFCETALPVGSDRDAALEQALAGAQVIVPLLSPHYFSKFWPRRELESFRRRLVGLDAPRRRRRVVPVLWVAVPTWIHNEDVRRAIELGADVPEYASDGLRALRRLSRDQRGDPDYHEIVRRVAERVVEVAEGELLQPDRTPVLVTHDSPPETGEAPLVVSVLAARTGNGAPEWRPFGDAESVSPAAAVISVAERFSLTTRVEDPVGPTGVPRYQFPTVLLVDPGVVATGAGEAQLRRIAEAIPEWVTPMVLAGRAGPEVQRQVARIKQILPGEGDNRARFVYTVADFGKVTPEAVAAAYSHYLQRNLIVKGPE
jgi:hypothetical protein